jgi:hypothetical protein
MGISASRTCACVRGDVPRPADQSCANGRHAVSTVRGSATLVAALGLAMMPKCPMCLVGWLWFSGAVGLGTVVGKSWFWWLLIAFLLASLASAVIRAGRCHGFAAFMAGSFAVAVLLVGKFSLDMPWLVVSGLLMLAVALVRDGRSVQGYTRSY